MLRRAIGPAIILAVLSACAERVGHPQPDQAEDNRALVQRFYEEFDAEPSLEVIDRWTAPDFVSHQAGAPAPQGLAAYREALRPFLTGFSEIRHDIRQTVSQGDRIALLVDITMRHTGEFAGLHPTHRTISVSEMLMLRIENEKIAEEWIVFDAASLMAQLQDSSSTPSP